MTRSQPTGAPEQLTSAYRAVLARIYSLAMDITLRGTHEVSVSYLSQCHMLYVSVYRIEEEWNEDGAPEQLSVIQAQYHVTLPPRRSLTMFTTSMQLLTAITSELEGLLELPGEPS